MATEPLELDVAIAEPEAHDAATARQHVEEGGVFGEADRIMQRRQGETESYGDAARRLHHRRAAYGATDPTNLAGWKWCSLTHTLSSPTRSAWTTCPIDSRTVSP